MAKRKFGIETRSSSRKSRNSLGESIKAIRLVRVLAQALECRAQLANVRASSAEIRQIEKKAWEKSQATKKEN